MKRILKLSSNPLLSLLILVVLHITTIFGYICTFSNVPGSSSFIPKGFSMDIGQKLKSTIWPEKTKMTLYMVDFSSSKESDLFALGLDPPRKDNAFEMLLIRYLSTAVATIVPDKYEVQRLVKPGMDYLGFVDITKVSKICNLICYLCEYSIVFFLSLVMPNCSIAIT